MTTITQAFGTVTDGTNTVDAGQQGTNTLKVVGATVSNLGGQPTLTITPVTPAAIGAPSLSTANTFSGFNNFSGGLQAADIISKGPWLDIRAIDGTLEGAVVAIGATRTTLVIPSDIVLTGDVVVPANIELVPLNGAVINHGAYALSILSSTKRWPDAKMFSGTGAITDLKESRVSWWGADGVYDTSPAGDDSLAFMSAINSLVSRGGTVLVGAGDFNLNIAPTRQNVTMRGAGMKRTQLYNNTTTAGVYCINWVGDAIASPTLPGSLNLSDMSIIGSYASNYHGLRIRNFINGEIKNIEFNDCGQGFLPSGCYNMNFTNLFFRVYGKGILTDDLAVNNDQFNNISFFGGNSANNAIPIYDPTGMFGECVFTNLIIEGSGQQSFSTLNGGGNTFVNVRWESSTPNTEECYVKVGGVNNRFINPMFTCAVETEVLTSGYFMEISGLHIVVDPMNNGGVAKRLVNLTAASKNCRVNIDTSGMINQIISNMWVDYGVNNLVGVNNVDFCYNNEGTWSHTSVQNNFLESTDMSTVVTDGLTRAVVTGADSRLGPFKEGLITGFTSPIGNRKWTQNICLADGPPASNGNISFSIWVRSLTAGGELVKFQMGRSTQLVDTATVYVPSDKFIRVAVFSKADSLAYTDYLVGMVAAVGSSGFHCYGPQVVFDYTPMSGSVLQPMIAGGYVPTTSVYARELAPCYSVSRKHKSVPVNGTGFTGLRVGTIKPVVGQPKGWLCTATGSPGTWVSEGNL